MNLDKNNKRGEWDVLTQIPIMIGNSEEEYEWNSSLAFTTIIVVPIPPVLPSEKRRELVYRLEDMITTFKMSLLLNPYYIDNILISEIPICWSEHTNVSEIKFILRIIKNAQEILKVENAFSYPQTQYIGTYFHGLSFNTSQETVQVNIQIRSIKTTQKRRNRLIKKIEEILNL